MIRWDCEPGVCYWTAAPLIISALGAAYSANRANKANQMQGEQMKAEQNLYKQAAPFANQQMQQSQQAIGPSLSYYTSMLADPRNATAPEQNRVGNMYAGAASASRNLGTRGMGPMSAMSLRNQELQAQTGIVQQGRPMAAQALGGMGVNLAQLGYQGMGLGAGILGNVFNQGLAANQQQFQQGAAVGGGLFNAYQSYLLGKALNSDMGQPVSGLYGTQGQIPTVPIGGNSNLWGNANPSGNLYGGIGPSPGVPNSGPSGAPPPPTGPGQ